MFDMPPIEISEQMVTDIISHSKLTTVVATKSYDSDVKSDVLRYDAEVPETTKDNRKSFQLTVKTILVDERKLGSYFGVLLLCEAVGKCEQARKDADGASKEITDNWQPLPNGIQVSSVLYGDISGKAFHKDGYVDVLITLSNGAGILVLGKKAS